MENFLKVGALGLLALAVIVAIAGVRTFREANNISGLVAAEESKVAKLSALRKNVEKRGKVFYPFSLYREDLEKEAAIYQELGMKTSVKMENEKLDIELPFQVVADGKVNINSEKGYVWCMLFIDRLFEYPITIKSLSVSMKNIEIGISLKGVVI